MKIMWKVDFLDTLQLEKVVTKYKLLRRWMVGGKYLSKANTQPTLKIICFTIYSPISKFDTLYFNKYILEVYTYILNLYL